MEFGSRNGDLKQADNSNRQTTLRGQDYADLGMRSPGMVSDNSPSINSLHNVTLKKGQEKDQIVTTQRQTKSAFQLKTLKKFHQSARSVTENPFA